MLIALFVILTLIAVVAYELYNKYDSDVLSISLGTVAFLGYFMWLIMTLAMIINTDFAIEKKIVMYEEENMKIEEQISTLVVNYMEYEKGIVYDCAPGDAMTLVTLYPDLASSQLVSVQMDVYIANSKKLKELKSQKYDTDIVRWWLYFG